MRSGKGARRVNLKVFSRLGVCFFEKREREAKYPNKEQMRQYLEATELIETCERKIAIYIASFLLHCEEGRKKIHKNKYLENVSRQPQLPNLKLLPEKEFSDKPKLCCYACNLFTVRCKRSQ